MDDGTVASPSVRHAKGRKKFAQSRFIPDGTYDLSLVKGSGQEPKGSSSQQASHLAAGTITDIDKRESVHGTSVSGKTLTYYKSKPDLFRRSVVFDPDSYYTKLLDARDSGQTDSTLSTTKGSSDPEEG